MSERIKQVVLSPNSKNQFQDPKYDPVTRLRSKCIFVFRCHAAAFDEHARKPSFTKHSHISLLCCCCSPKDKFQIKGTFSPSVETTTLPTDFWATKSPRKIEIPVFPGQPAWPFSWPLDQRLYLNWIGGSWDREDLSFFCATNVDE